MAEKKHESVTLVKGNRKVTTSLPSEIVQYKAAGWRVEEAEKRQDVESAQLAPAPSVDAPKSTEDPGAGDSPRPATAQVASKGGAKK